MIKSFQLKALESNFGPLVEGLNIQHRRGFAHAWTFIFLTRRLAYAASLIFFFNTPTVVLTVMPVLSLAHIYFFVHSRPFSALPLFLNMINEFMLAILFMVVEQFTSDLVLIQLRK